MFNRKVHPSRSDNFGDIGQNEITRSPHEPDPMEDDREILTRLPSRQACRSPEGTTGTRQRMASIRQRRKSTICLRHGRRPSVTPSVVLDVEIEARRARKGRFDRDGDGDYDEIDRIKEMELIKQMPVSFEHKKILRAKLLEYSPELMSGGCDYWWYKNKLTCFQCCLRSNRQFKEILGYLNLWQDSFRTIEAMFGSGVLTYFRFLKWLFLLNFFLFLMMFLFVVIPQIVFTDNEANKYVVTNSSNNTAIHLASNCSALYNVNVSSDALQLIVDFLQGTGWMEQTVMFYGYYSDGRLLILSAGDAMFNYSMPLAYLMVTGACLLISLVFLIHSTARGFGERIVSKEETHQMYCNKTLGSWDYGLTDQSAALLTHRHLTREFYCSLDEQRREAERQGRSMKTKCKVWSIRAGINLLVAALLAGAAWLIVYTTNQTLEVTRRSDFTSLHQVVQLLVEYMTSLTITILNAVLPIVFKKIVILEDYTTAGEVNITLVRTVLLKLASVAVLLGSLFTKINCETKDYCSVGTGPCTSIRCWETTVGQELYKLVIMDFLIVCCVVFLVELPRKLIITKCDCKLSKMIGPQEFDIPKNILDLVYSEALLWLGMFFSPIIPGIAFVKNFLIFYMKKLSVLVCCRPSSKPYRASDSQQLFMMVLLSTYAVCSFPIIYVIFLMKPSRGCGPFRVYSYMINIVDETVLGWPQGLQSAWSVMTSAAVVIPLLIALCLAIYYLVMIIGAYKEKARVMKEQLVMEGQDKQFLVKRLQNAPVENGSSHGPGRPRARRPELQEE